jgi:hypothetical protein
LRLSHPDRDLFFSSAWKVAGDRDQPEKLIVDAFRRIEGFKGGTPIRRSARFRGMTRPKSKSVMNQQT